MTSQSAATLRSRYVEQAASDLEKNHSRQQELAEAIARLKQEEALLVDILTLAERYEGPPESSHLPKQAQDVPEPRQANQVPRAEAVPSAGAPGSSVPHPHADEEANAQGKTRRPLLGDVLTMLLGAHAEPRLAKELRDELLRKYPDRNPTPQVVRNTLEALVAKGRVQRHKQQRSVMYSLAAHAAPDIADGEAQTG
ncbi:hypothetical protein [Streptomyces sp. NPDC007856]|uniref:hypothetical protein n=1 Tax=Streptomyces sp. NPDC007856 TaxID=3364781 RepID=UPI0036911FC4